MRIDKQQRHDRLCEMIQQTITESGYDKDGHQWAVRSMDDWAQDVGVTGRSIHALVKIAPIQTLDTGATDEYGVFRRVTALRVGEAGSGVEKSQRHIANIMAKMFREKTERPVLRKAYGCLNGLAGIWPQGHQVAIFKDMLNDWGSFMAAAKLRMTIEAGAYGKTGLQVRYYRYPVISLFPHVAADAYLTHLQTSSADKAYLPFPYHYVDH